MPIENTIAIIPARGGSVGIPRKNVVRILGKPLLAYTIEQALAATSVDRVIVSTDDAEIAGIAREWGAEVVSRPAEISGSKATSESALLHTLDFLRDSEGYDPGIAVFLQATSPLRQPGDIQSSIDTLIREGADSLFSGTPTHGFIWRMDHGVVSSFSYDHRNRPRRQEVPQEFVENGSIYVFKPWVLRRFNNRLGGKISIHRMHPLDSFQVDELSDLGLMETLLSIRRPNLPASDALARVRLLALDFDGVMTDNRVLVGEDGSEAVWCNRADGWGLARLKERGDVEVVVISTEANPVVGARCAKLGLHFVQSCDDKLSALRDLARDRGITAAEVAYVGNDVNDLPCLRWVGTPIAVKDAAAEVLALARLVTTRPGGHGAVREAADWLLSRPERGGERDPL